VSKKGYILKKDFERVFNDACEKKKAYLRKNCKSFSMFLNGGQILGVLAETIMHTCNILSITQDDNDLSAVDVSQLIDTLYKEKDYRAIENVIINIVVKVKQYSNITLHELAVTFISECMDALIPKRRQCNEISIDDMYDLTHELITHDLLPTEITLHPEALTIEDLQTTYNELREDSPMAHW
jgi:hypothetical protein